MRFLPQFCAKGPAFLTRTEGNKTFGHKTFGHSAHDFVFSALDGVDLALKDFNGKAVLVVNTASACGFTRQYRDLQLLWTNYQARGLVVLGVPSNDFGRQEPGSEKEIAQFCSANFAIDFPMTAKTHVKGIAAHDFYKWAAGESGWLGRPKWNFHKYLIDPNGHLVKWFASPTSPVSAKVIKAIETVLPA